MKCQGKELTGDSSLPAASSLQLSVLKTFDFLWQKHQGEKSAFWLFCLSSQTAGEGEKKRGSHYFCFVIRLVISVCT